MQFLQRNAIVKVFQLKCNCRICPGITGETRYASLVSGSLRQSIATYTLADGDTDSVTFDSPVVGSVDSVAIEATLTPLAAGAIPASACQHHKTNTIEDLI